MDALTDEQALEIAARHGLNPAETPQARKRVADFVRAVYKEGRDAHVMRVGPKGGRKISEGNS